MPPPKRRNDSGKTEHRGRVTTHRSEQPLPRATAPAPLASKRHASGVIPPIASSRYTPPIKSVRFRPDWHKAVGFVLLAIGISVVVLNDIVLLGAPVTLLPGGHSELYLILGVIIAGYSTWWFGWFDREK